jgi:uncharacterized protein (TIGR02246 family)
VLWVVLATLGVVLLIGGVLWLVVGGNGVSIEDEAAAVEQLLVDQEQAQNAKDADAMVAMLAEDVVVHMNDLPALVGREAMMQAYTQLWPVFVSIDFTVSETVIADSGDWAWMHGTQLMELDLPDAGRVSAPGRWMTVLEKTDGEWLVTALSVGDVAPPSG